MEQPPDCLFTETGIQNVDCELRNTVHWPQHMYKKKNPKPKTLKVQITCKVLVAAPDVPEFNAARTKIAMKVVS